jgi:hypothetical protein
MNKNTMEKDYAGVGQGLSKLAAEDAKRKGYTHKTKAQKRKEKEAKR